MDKIILYLTSACMVMLLIFSCRSNQQIIESRVDSVYVQRLVPITLPSDTARLKALLECNAQGKVVAHQLNIYTTRNARLNFLLDSMGNLQVQSVTKFDTIWLKADSVHIKTILTEYVEIPAEFTNWERFSMKFGVAMFWIIVGIIIVGIIYIIIRMKLKK